MKSLLVSIITCTLICAGVISFIITLARTV